MKRIVTIIILSLLVSCGVPDIAHREQPPVQSTSPSGQQASTATATADVTETAVWQTQIVEGQTSEAGYWELERQYAHLTMTAIADPEPTMDINNLPTLEPYTPLPTLEFRLFTHQECDIPSQQGKSGTQMTITNCWHGLVNGHDLFVKGIWINHPQGQSFGDSFIYVTELGESIDYHYPTKQGALTIVDVQLPNLVISVGGNFNALFNLQTRQWLNLSGTPVSGTTTPTNTAVPPTSVNTSTPTGQYVQSLTLINADTDQPIAGYDPLQTGATLNFATLGTQNLNIRANTVPATVGSVKFVLDGSPFRIEGGAPYALNGNNGNDYYAWTPSLGNHTLQVIPYTAGNATGTQGTGMTVNFTVTNGTAATATNTTVPPTATRTNTPVPATNTPSGTPKTALFVVSNASSLNAGDTVVKTRLEGLGYTVTLKTASASATSDATGKTLVLISSSVASGDVNTKFKSVTVPVIVWEYALYDDMAMTGPTSGTDFGYNTGTSMVITNATHPLAAGLSGTVSLYSASTNIPYGVTGANAISVGAVSTTSTRRLEFAYDKNVAMVGGFTVNARRVGIFLVDTATPTADAWTLFDAAVNWAIAP